MIDRDPDSVVAHSALAGLWLTLGQADQALAHLDAAVALDRQDHVLLDPRGTIRQQTGQVEEALEAFNQALEIAPGSLVARGNRG